MIRIGLTTYYEKIESQFSAHIPYDYISALFEYDAVPLLIPVTDDDKILEKYLLSVEGVLLTGGVDIDPGLYNEKNTGLSHTVCKQRDRAEMYIIDRALKKGLPILGICRGLQILNVFFGGTLYQDIQNQYNTGIIHSNPIKKIDELHHEVNIDPESHIGRLFREGRAMVNSRHHQGVKRAGAGLSISAISDDGIIEAFENSDRSVVAVQWHPENITDVSAGCRELFRDLVDRAGAHDHGHL